MQHGEQQSAQQDYDPVQTDHDGDSSGYTYEGDNRRPSSRGSKHGLEQGGVYGGQGYQGHYDSPNPHSEHMHGDNEEDDDDTW
jgi:hypothetical protein